MQLVGIDINEQYLKLLLIEKQNRQIYIRDFVTFCSFEELDDYLGKICSKKNIYIVSSLSTLDLFIKDIKIPLKNHKAALRVLPFQLESLLPFSLDEAICINQSKKEKEGIIVKNFSVSTKSLDRHLKRFINDQPHFVTADPCSLFQAAKYLTGESSLLMIHLKDRECLFCASSDNGLIAATTCFIGYQTFFQTACKDLPKSSKEEIKFFLENLEINSLSKDDFPHLYSLIELFKKECDRALYFLLGQKNARQLDKVFLSGYFRLLKSFSSSIENSLEFPLEVLEKKFDNQELKLREFALPLGACLNILDEKTGVEFRSKEHISNNCLQRLKKQIGYTVLSLVSLCIFLCLSGFCFFNQKEKVLEKKLMTFVYQYNSQHPDLVRRLKNEKLPFLQKLRLAKKTFGGIQKPVRFYDEKPLLSEALHELTVLTDQIPSISIEELKFVLEEFPNLENPSKDYKVHMYLWIDVAQQKAFDSFCEKLKSVAIFKDINQWQCVHLQGDKYEIQFAYFN